MQADVTSIATTLEGKRVLEAWNRLCTEIDSRAWGEGFFFGGPRVKPNVDPYATRVVNPYCYFPFLWQDAFPQVGLQQMRDLAEGARFYLDYLKNVDDLLDGDTTFEPLSGFTAFSYHYRALRAFYRVLPPDSPTWQYFEQYNDDNLCGLQLERLRHVEILMPYSLDEMQAIATGKHAIAKWIVAVMASLAGREDWLRPLASSLDCYYTGIQLLDDVRDWRIDYQRRNFSYLLTQCIFDQGLSDAVNSAAPPDVNTVGVALFQSGYILQTLEQASDLFCRALKQVNGIPCAAWTARVESDRAAGEETRRKVREATELKKARHGIHQAVREARAPLAPPSAVDHAMCLRRAVDYLLREQRSNFASAYHTESYHVELAGFPTIADVQRGNTFQRAIIVDALLDACRPGAAIDRPVMEQELTKLVEAKATDVGGGWRYFSDFPIIPPDADSLGAMLQAFVRGAYPDVAQVCEDAVAFLFSWGWSEQGWFETWLVNPEDNSHAGRWLKAARDAFWGHSDGKDAEVTANVLYGLHLYDAKRFEERVAQGVSFLENQQTADGYWSSYWYCGKYYGTYVCSRIISNIRPDSPALSKALDFLLRSQNFDGGWGAGGDLRRLQRFTPTPGSAAGEMSAYSDPLNTALALLALFWIHQAGYPAPFAAVARGIVYLQERQLLDGCWERVEMGFTVRGKRPYGSRPFSTAFCLKALVSWDSVRTQNAAAANDGTATPHYRFCFAPDPDPNFRARLEAPGFVSGPLPQVDAGCELRAGQDQTGLCERIKSILDRCGQEAALPRQLDIFLLGHLPARSLCRGFEFRSDPALAIAVDRLLPAGSGLAAAEEHGYDKLQAPLTREYGRTLLALEGCWPTNLLEVLWEEGVAVAFGLAVCGSQALAELLEMTDRELTWCQRNSQYLWQGAKPMLREMNPLMIEKLWPKLDAEGDGYPKGVGRFLGHKLVADYQARNGAKTWRELRRIAPEAFIG